MKTSQRGIDLIKRLPPHFSVLSGDDATALSLMLLGGKGVISVTANVAPRLCADLQAACLAEDYAKARALNDQLHGLHTALFTDASPAPVKYALTRVLAGFPDELRLPLVAASAGSRASVDAGLAHAGLI